MSSVKCYMSTYISLVLRIGLAFAFLYPPISAFFDPFSWIGYFPNIAHAIIPNDMLLLHTFGVFEVALALWILSGRGPFYSSSLAAFVLIVIVIFNYPQMDVLFRDLSIAAMAIALAISSTRPKNT